MQWSNSGQQRKFDSLPNTWRLRAWRLQKRNYSELSMNQRDMRWNSRVISISPPTPHHKWSSKKNICSLAAKYFATVQLADCGMIVIWYSWEIRIESVFWFLSVTLLLYDPCQDKRNIKLAAGLCYLGACHCCAPIMWSVAMSPDDNEPQQQFNNLFPLIVKYFCWVLTLKCPAVI